MISTSKLLKAYDRSRVPLYLQVAAVMRQRIETKYWAPGEQIPTLEQLEVEFQVARITVRQAVDMLRTEELLYCRQGRGTFVANKTKDKRWLKLATDWQSLADSLKGNVPKLISAPGAAAVSPILSGEDGKSSGAYVFLRSVQFKDGEPYGIVNLHLADEIYRRAPDEFRQHPALSVLAGLKGVDIQDAHQTVVIGSADPATADHLRIALGAPIAECRCVVIDERGIAIYVADIIYRSDAIKLHIDLLAGSRGASKSVARARPAKKSGSAAAATSGLRSCN
jgi:GntR family transcriptional regulator